MDKLIPLKKKTQLHFIYGQKGLCWHCAFGAMISCTRKIVYNTVRVYWMRMRKLFEVKNSIVSKYSVHQGQKGAFLVTLLLNNPPAMQETWVRSLGWKDPLKKGKATHSSNLAWRIPWTVQSMGSEGLSLTHSGSARGLLYNKSCLDPNH